MHIMSIWKWSQENIGRTHKWNEMYYIWNGSICNNTFVLSNITLGYTVACSHWSRTHFTFTKFTCTPAHVRHSFTAINVYANVGNIGYEWHTRELRRRIRYCAHADNRTSNIFYWIFLHSHRSSARWSGHILIHKLYYFIIFDYSQNIINRTEYVDVWVLQQRRQRTTKAQRISNTSSADVQLRKRYKLVITNCIGHISIYCIWIFPTGGSCEFLYSIDRAFSVIFRINYVYENCIVVVCIAVASS